MVKEIFNYLAGDLTAMSAEEIADHALPGEPIETDAEWDRLGKAIEIAINRLHRLGG